MEAESLSHQEGVMFANVAPLVSAAFRILRTKRDRDLIGKLTVVQGYLQLLEREPDNTKYQRCLRIATEELRMLVHVAEAEPSVMSAKTTSLTRT